MTADTSSKIMIDFAMYTLQNLYLSIQEMIFKSVEKDNNSTGLESQYNY